MKSRQNTLLKVLIVFWFMNYALTFTYQKGDYVTHLLLLATELIMFFMSIYYLVLCYKSGEDIGRGYVLLIGGIYMVWTILSFMLNIQWSIDHNGLIVKAMVFLFYHILSYFDEKNKKFKNTQVYVQVEKSRLKSYVLKNFDNLYKWIANIAFITWICIEFTNSSIKFVVTLFLSLIMVSLAIIGHYLEKGKL